MFQPVQLQPPASGQPGLQSPGSEQFQTSRSGDVQCPQLPLIGKMCQVPSRISSGPEGSL